MNRFLPFCVGCAAAVVAAAPPRVEVLTASGGLPAHIAGAFQEPTSFQQAGTPLRTIGALRPTGHEAEHDLHLALNVGLPVINPKGGFYFVFQTGVPMFRAYDARGRLRFERHIEGPEVDPLLAAIPTTWPRRQTPDGELPLVIPNLRTAAADRDGNLWISLLPAFTYVYDEVGDKTRTVQFKTVTGILAPVGLSCSPAGHLLVAPGCYEFNAQHRQEILPEP